MEENYMECLFCNIPKKRIIAENEHAYAIRDGFPSIHRNKVPTGDYIEEVICEKRLSF